MDDQQDQNPAPVVEDNNQPAPTDETTLTNEPTEGETEQSEQAIVEDSQSQDEPSEKPADPEEKPEVQRKPRVERRFDQMTKKLAEASQKVQPQVPQFTQQNVPSIQPDQEYSAEDLDQILSQKAQAISQQNTAMFAAQLQARDMVQNYVNTVTEDTADLRKHPLLNPENNPDAEKMEEKIGQLYERANPIEKDGKLNPNFDPNFRLKDFALEYLEEVERYQQKGQVESSSQLANAADSAVIQPSGEVTTNVDDNSTEALREKLANVQF